MSRAPAFVLALLLLIASGRSLWMSFTAMALATPVPREAGREQIERRERYDGLADALRGAERAGYIGDGDPLASERYLFARLGALPTVLTPSADENIIVVDGASDADLDRMLADESWRVRPRGRPRARGPDNLLILERRE